MHAQKCYVVFPMLLLLLLLFPSDTPIPDINLFHSNAH